VRCADELRKAAKLITRMSSGFLMVCPPDLEYFYEGRWINLILQQVFDER
jgi:hypothetical protein